EYLKIAGCEVELVAVEMMYVFVRPQRSAELGGCDDPVESLTPHRPSRDARVALVVDVAERPDGELALLVALHADTCCSAGVVRAAAYSNRCFFTNSLTSSDGCLPRTFSPLGHTPN